MESLNNGGSYANGDFDGSDTPDGPVRDQAWDITALSYAIHPDKHGPFVNHG
jgi:hypothetical protein